MSDYYAACTPNSLPEDGRTQHGYQLTVLDDAMRVLEAVDFPEWDTFQQEEAETWLAGIGYVFSVDSEWTPAGLGFMTPVVRVDGL